MGGSVLGPTEQGPAHRYTLQKQRGFLVICGSIKKKDEIVGNKFMKQKYARQSMKTTSNLFVNL